MRTPSEIKKDIELARQKCVELENELQAALLAEFLQKAGVPTGARPIFANHKGERVLVVGFDDYWALGKLIKKDGTISNGAVRRLYDFDDDYHYVGEN